MGGGEENTQQQQQHFRASGSSAASSASSLFDLSDHSTSSYTMSASSGPRGSSSSNDHHHHHNHGIVTLPVGGGSSREMSMENMTLTSKPHAFAGAVLSPKHAKELTPSLCLAIASALADQSHRKAAVPYTLWITEAWRVLGWAEPSAALFWELATMYHTLYLAGRAFAADYQDGTHIPPILSCGSTSSMGSGATADRPASIDKKKFSTAASAKELPVWLVGTFLLLHCEEFAYQRNLSGQDERRFFGQQMNIDSLNNGGKMDFSSLFKHPSLSPRTRLHAGWYHDNTHCTAYLIRHLRKVLLLTAVSHNPDAVRACMHLAAIPSPAPGPPLDKFLQRRSSNRLNRHSFEDLHRLHDEEHANVGRNVNLTMEDLERLHLILQAPSGGGIEDPPLKIGELIFKRIYHTVPPPTASVPIIEVEREIRRHLELELLMAGIDDKDDMSSAATPPDDEDSAANALAKLNLSDRPSGSGKAGSAAGPDDPANFEPRAKQPNNHYHKELSYTHLRGTTILLKPNPTEASSGASSASGEHNFVGNIASSGRLHDLAISECSDAHFYLLQPFEHVSISACTNCTIVVGAIAGLLHVVDCEKTNITSAARRILVSNSVDVQLCVFTPSPPLLVGDNRSVQFAPYNTYYDGLREDLLATGLAAAVVPENQSPYHGTRSVENDAAWPPLQCASNKWKQPVELSKLEVPQMPATGSTSPPTTPGNTSPPGADDKAMGKSGGRDDSMLSPILMPASEFHIIFVPIESDTSRQRRQEGEENNEDAANGVVGNSGGQTECQYCQLLAEVLQLSPFRLPVEYERRVLMKAERIRNIQQAVKKNLGEEQQQRFEEELNRGFRDWLVTSGNLRQVLDLVHLERRGGV